MQNEPTDERAHRQNDRAPALAVGIALILGCGFLLLAGCASGTNHRLLSFFFDGVPTPGATNAGPVLTDDDQPLPVGATVAAAPAQSAVPHTLHPPFHDQQCTECHESKFSQKMKGPMNAVCFSCHDDFLAKAKIKHQPAESGDCKSCHEPHESPNKKLLIRTGNAMCLECHDNPVATGKVKHQAVESGNCLDCHGPHASNVKGLLKKPLAASCFECHDDFLKTAKVKHAPAENGECMSCHAAHQSGFKALLIKPDPKLCFDCHEEADVAKVDAHKKSDSSLCLTCHNPHGGADSKLLRPTAMPRSPGAVSAQNAGHE